MIRGSASPVGSRDVAWLPTLGFVSFLGMVLQQVFLWSGVLVNGVDAAVDDNLAKRIWPVMKYNAAQNTPGLRQCA